MCSLAFLWCAGLLLPFRFTPLFSEKPRFISPRLVFRTTSNLTKSKLIKSCLALQQILNLPDSARSLWVHTWLCNSDWPVDFTVGEVFVCKCHKQGKSISLFIYCEVGNLGFSFYTSLRQFTSLWHHRRGKDACTNMEVCMPSYISFAFAPFCQQGCTLNIMHDRHNRSYLCTSHFRFPFQTKKNSLNPEAQSIAERRTRRKNLFTRDYISLCFTSMSHGVRQSGDRRMSIHIVWHGCQPTMKYFHPSKPSFLTCELPLVATSTWCPCPTICHYNSAVCLGLTSELPYHFIILTLESAKSARIVQWSRRKMIQILNIE